MHSGEIELGYLASPDGSSRAGVVIVHDVWGLSDHYRDLARRFAAEGFTTLAVNCYRGLGTVEISDPGAWMRGLSDPDLLAQVARAAQELRDAHGSSRVAVVGFCMGGSYALMAGCGTPGIDAVVPFYGILSHGHGLLHAPEGLDPRKKPREPLAAAAHLACPLLAFFGAEDAYVPVSDVEDLKQALARTAQPSEVVVYPDAGHAFMNDTRPQAYRPEIAADAWRRMTAFLHQHLGA